MFEELKDAWVSEKTFDVEVKGEKKTISYPELGSLRVSPDRDVRRMATETIYQSIDEDKIIYGTAMNVLCQSLIYRTQLSVRQTSWMPE